MRPRRENRCACKAQQHEQGYDRGRVLPEAQDVVSIPKPSKDARRGRFGHDSGLSAQTTAAKAWVHRHVEEVDH